MRATDFTRDFDAVLAAERERIAEQRARRGVRRQPTIGLALSGGGIRSASFGLGVLQALAAAQVFRMLDYLSTVSGGGYTGTALTWLLRSGGSEFPLADDGAHPAFDRLRRQADYLSPTAHLTLRALFAVVLQHALFSLLVYGGLLVGLFVALDVVDQALRPLRALGTIYADGRWTDRLLSDANALLVASAACLVLFAAQAILSPVGHALQRLRSADPPTEERAYLHRRKAVRRASTLLQATLVTGVLGTVPLAARLLAQCSARDGLVALAGVALVVIAATWRGRSALAAALVAFVLLYAFLLGTHAVALSLLMGSAPWAIWVVGGGALVLGAITSLDAHGSERVYRDRLIEAFMPDETALRDPRGRPAKEAAGYPLAAACGSRTAGPYHLLNAALLTTASRQTSFRRRGAASFVFAPLFCGGDATGWRATAAWTRGTTTLACAMATSAAAVDPHAAVAGSGATRGTLTSLLLALLGLRLGHVAPNPERQSATRFWLPPNLLVPGLAQAFFGDARESTRYVTLADGGDFECLGIYELVRRRLDVIIAVDATQDAAWTFDGLGNAVARVRADFGVDITFTDLDGLRLAPHRAHAVGRIRYPGRGGQDARDGVIVYVKAKMLDGVPPDVVAQARTHPEFPHESTLDQCFDEGKFEAYRGLGKVAARRLLDDPTVVLALFPPGDAPYAPPHPVDRGAS